MSILMPERPTNAEQLREAITNAQCITVVTGAGISVAAGFKTYRDRGSGWTDGDLESKSHASRYGNHLPELWRFWGGLRANALFAQPTTAHLALVDPRVTVLTQNIDGLHKKAGSNTIELRGSVTRTRCIRCKKSYEDDRFPDCAGVGDVPDCLECGYRRRTRVDVVLFGEELRSCDVKAARVALMASDVCLYVGTSGTVWPVADFAGVARRSGAVTALANRDPWVRGGEVFDVTVLGDADDVVPHLMGLTPA